jgi:hypothetical protein
METDPRRLLKYAPIPLRLPIRRALNANARLAKRYEERLADLSKLRHPRLRGAQLLLLRAGEQVMRGNAALAEALGAWRLGRMPDGDLRRAAERMQRVCEALENDLDEAWPD